MTTEQLLRDQLSRATADVPLAPDLEQAVTAGRRTRRRRRAGLAAAAAAVVGVAGSLGVVAVSGDDGPTVAHDASVAGSSAPDYVAGTDFDTQFAAVIAEHLPALPDPDDVYPSDSHTAGPLPDADFARAEDWQATYTIGGSDFLVITSAPSEGPFRCHECAKQELEDGTLYRQVFTSGTPEKWYFGVSFARPDGSAVSAYESLAGRSESAAAADRQLSDAEVAALVQDGRLRFTGAE